MEIRYRRIRERDEAPSTYYYKVDLGLLPPPVHLGKRSSAIPVHEDDLCNAAALAGLSNDQRRDLVKALVAIRPEFLAGRGEEALAQVRAKFSALRQSEPEAV